jgi:hypothetical protein
VRGRVSWPPVLEHAADIVPGHDTMMTIRQAF